MDGLFRFFELMEGCFNLFSSWRGPTRAAAFGFRAERTLEVACGLTGDNGVSFSVIGSKLPINLRLLILGSDSVESCLETTPARLIF